MIENWAARAFNQDPESPNEIHGDDLAQKYGFEGGLVPGVTISAYITHPAVEYWGADFLERGHAHVKVVKPLYDGEDFRVEIDEQSATGYRARLLRAADVVSAQATVGINDDLPNPPRRRGDPVAARDYTPPKSSRTIWELLRAQGCKAFRYHWGGEHKMSSYLHDPNGMPQLLRGENAFANMSFILALSNFSADGNATMNPWVHLETRSQNFRAIAPGTDIIAETAVVDLFEKKGHEFFDAEVNLFDAADDGCLTTIWLRAIYHLAGSQGG
ncbi:MAG: hypothetical protein HKN19_12860 [Halioglobus sp.]|nr:hypothetical protein [Halioglobus sp.]